MPTNNTRGRRSGLMPLALASLATSACSQLEQARADWPWIDNAILGAALIAAAAISDQVRRWVFAWRTGPPHQDAGILAHKRAWVAFWVAFFVLLLVIMGFYSQLAGSR